MFTPSHVACVTGDVAGSKTLRWMSCAHHLAHLTRSNAMYPAQRTLHARRAASKQKNPRRHESLIMSVGLRPPSRAASCSL